MNSKDTKTSFVILLLTNRPILYLLELGQYLLAGLESANSSILAV